MDLMDDYNRQTTLSLVIPVLNEEGSLPLLYDKINTALKDSGQNTEIIFIDDGSTDRTHDILTGLSGLDKRLRLFSFTETKGQHKALEKGFTEARSNLIITLDGDLQNDPCDIPMFIEKMNEGFDLVCGWRRHRKDNINRIMISKLGNTLQRIITGLKLHDLGCNMRAYRKHILRDISFRDKYAVCCLLPIILSKRTKKITEIRISHNARRSGISKHGFLTLCLGVISAYLRTIRE